MARRLTDGIEQRVLAAGDDRAGMEAVPAAEHLIVGVTECLRRTLLTGKADPGVLLGLDVVDDHQFVVVIKRKHIANGFGACSIAATHAPINGYFHRSLMLPCGLMADDLPIRTLAVESAYVTRSAYSKE